MRITCIYVNFLELDCINKKAIKTSDGLKLETIGFNTKNSKIYPTTKDYKMKNGLQNRILFVVDEINILDTLGILAVPNVSPAMA